MGISLVPNTPHEGLTLLSTTTLSGSSVTLSSIPQTYRNLQLVIRSYKPSGDGETLWGRFNSDTNTRYRNVATTPGQDALTFNVTRFDVSGSQDNTAATGLIIMDIYDYTNTQTWKIAESRSVNVNSATPANLNFTSLSVFYNQTSAISDIVLFPSGGTLTSGTALLYGVN